MCQSEWTRLVFQMRGIPAWTHRVAYEVSGGAVLLYCRDLGCQKVTTVVMAWGHHWALPRHQKEAGGAP